MSQVRLVVSTDDELLLDAQGLLWPPGVNDRVCKQKFLDISRIEVLTCSLTWHRQACTALCSECVQIAFSEAGMYTEQRQSLPHGRKLNSPDCKILGIRNAAVEARATWTRLASSEQLTNLKQVGLPFITKQSLHAMLRNTSQNKQVLLLLLSG